MSKLEIVALPFSLAMLTLLGIALGMIGWLAWTDLVVGPFDPVKDGPPALIRTVGILAIVLWSAAGVLTMAAFSFMLLWVPWHTYFFED